MQATQDPAHASNLTKAISLDKFAVVIKHFDWQRSHTQRH